MVNAISHIQASWLSDYNGGIYDDSRQEKKACFGRINKIIFRCCEQATDSTCKYNLNHEVSSQLFQLDLNSASTSTSTSANPTSTTRSAFLARSKFCKYKYKCKSNLNHEVSFSS